MGEPGAVARIEVVGNDEIPVWVYSWGGKRVHNRVQIGAEIVEILDAGPGWALIRRLPREAA